MKLLKFNTGLIEISRLVYLIPFLVVSIGTNWNTWVMYYFFLLFQPPLLIIIFYTFIEQIIFLKKIPNIWFKILFLLSPLIFMLITLKKNSLIIENEYIFLSYKKIMRILIWLLIIVSVGGYLLSMIVGYIEFNDTHWLEFLENTHMMWLYFIAYLCVIPILFIILVQFLNINYLQKEKNNLIQRIDFVDFLNKYIAKIHAAVNSVYFNTFKTFIFADYGVLIPLPFNFFINLI